MGENVAIARGAVGACHRYCGNVPDGYTLEDVLAQIEDLTGRTLKTATVDKDYKEKQTIEITQINTPKPPLKKDNEYQTCRTRMGRFIQGTNLTLLTGL